MIAVGARLPLDLPLRVARGGEKHETTLGALIVARPTVVSVYMRNNTGSCDKQTDSLAAHAAEFERRGYGLVALSRDTCGSHLKYAAKKGIGFALISDPDDAFARAADAIVEKSMYGRAFTGPARAAFVVATDGRVLAVLPKVEPARHAAQLFALLDTLA